MWICIATSRLGRESNRVNKTLAFYSGPGCTRCAAVSFAAIAVPETLIYTDVRRSRRGRGRGDDARVARKSSSNSRTS